MAFIATKTRGASVTASGSAQGSRFGGIDACSSDSEISLSRADGESRYTGQARPGTVNMIRTGMGEISKRAGYSVAGRALQDGTVTDVHIFSSPEGETYFYIYGAFMLVNDGSYSLEGQSGVTVELPDDFTGCKSFQTDKYMFLLNGSYMFIYDTSDGSHRYIGCDGTTDIASAADTYLPTLLIGNTPRGSGEPYEPINMINPYVCEQYVADGTTKNYKIHLEPTGIADIRGYIKLDDGEWGELELLTYEDGWVYFKYVPAAPTVTGEDNVRIVYKRLNAENAFYSIAGCRCATLFGINGYKDRVFLSANDRVPDLVYYSEMDKPLYYPDLNYLKIGSADTHIRALAGQGTSLAVICSDNVYTVSGTLSEVDTLFSSDALFVITGIYKTPDPVPGTVPVVFDNEVVYLTSDGVCALAASGIMDERCAQIRSAFINRHLLNSELTLCRMLTADDFLVITDTADRLYLLDGKQSGKSSDQPFSHRQYEGYIWENVPAKCMWMQDKKLHFTDGTLIYGFNSGLSSNSEYHDETGIDGYGMPICSPVCAYWETPAIYCGDFYMNKFFSRLGVLIDSESADDGAPLNTDIKISARFDGDGWRTIRDYGAEHSVFRYGNISYGFFTYRDKPKSYALNLRPLHKKGRSIKLRFENGNIDQPFTIKQFGIEYAQM